MHQLRIDHLLFWANTKQYNFNCITTSKYTCRENLEYHLLLSIRFNLQSTPHPQRTSASYAYALQVNTYLRIVNGWISCHNLMLQILC